MKRILYTLCLLLPFALHGQINPTYYEQAYQELSFMLNDETDASFKKAVFITENAWFENTLDYEAFQQQIDHLKLLAENVAFGEGLPYTGKDRDQVLKYWSAFSVLKDTVRFKIEKNGTAHYFETEPFTYDFEDFFGEKDWRQMFVTKLLATHKGNCHSLPYLYKILVEEMGGEANLAMSPNHIYIKQWTEETGWFNTELTSGQFPIDAWIMASGYIKLEAIQNRLFMEALDQKQSIAVALVDLAQGYQKKFGELEDFDFSLQMLNTALEYYPHYAHAKILKAETLKAKFTKMMESYTLQKPSELREIPEGELLFDQMQLEYKSLTELGYRKMPREMYLNWLMDIEENQTNTQVEKYQFKAPQPFEKWGYEIPVATLSNGKYQEFFDSDSIIQVGTVMMNRFTGQVQAFIEYDTLYSEATLEPEVISRWLQPDPKADERDGLSPYNFVQNNPVLRVDPDGQLDEYFDEEGNYLGSDDAETDEVRIISADLWNAAGARREDGSIFMSHEVGQAHSTALVDTELDDDAIVGIVTHFNDQLDDKSKKANAKLKVDDLPEGSIALAETGGGLDIKGFTIIKTKNDITVDAKDGLINKNLGTASNIMNTLVHEHKHLKDGSIGRVAKELRGIRVQQAHPTYSKTTPEFKKLVNTYKDIFERLRDGNR